MAANSNHTTEQSPDESQSKRQSNSYTVERISIDELRAMSPQELDQRLDGAIARYERVMRRVLSEAAAQQSPDQCEGEVR